MKKVVLFLAFFIQGVLSAIQLNQVAYDASHASEDNVKLIFSEKLVKSPELKINSYMVQLEFIDVSVWPKIEQKFSWKDKDFDSSIMAYQYTKGLVRFRIVFPEKIEIVKDLIKIKVNEKDVIVTFPKFKTIAQKFHLRQETPTEEKIHTLLNEQVIEKNSVTEKEESLTEQPPLITEKSTVAPSLVATKMARQVPSTPSLSTHMGGNINLPWGHFFKYLIFLGFILGLFYLLVLLLKKGVLGKGKLNFLNSSTNVVVLSNNYIAPKRSLMTVKVQDQVFLLSNCENGISFLAEIRDSVNYVKADEKALTGHNFDTQLDKKNDTKEEIVLKEDIHKSTPVEKNSFSLKFSDQLKKKIKNLRPLQ